MLAGLSLSLLGTFYVAMGERPLSGFESNKVRALLAYLAVESERPHTRDELAGLLWPDSPDETARRNLRQALNNLRQTLRDAAASPPYLHISRDAIQWNGESDFWLDVAAFERLMRACAEHDHRHGSRCRSCARRREEAAALYRGDFLAHFFLADSQPFEEWLLLTRESIRRQVMSALYQLTAYYEETGEAELAQRYAARQLELDPWREEAHRQLMRALAAGGQRSAALAQYHLCRRILERDLGARPTQATNDLFAQIRAEKGETVSFTRMPVRALPLPLTPFIGRRHEMAQLTDWLERSRSRLLTVTGPGGVGKTRLALRAAREQASTFDDGAAFVNLGPIGDAAHVASTIAQALALPLNGRGTPAGQLHDFLAGREILLLLDDFDPLLHDPRSRHLVEELLERAPRLTLLVTSRETLGIRGERVLEVGGLPLEVEGAGADEGTTSNAEGDAITLFVQHARRVRADFQLTEATRPAVTRICHLVEGLPLALELAAAWVRQLTCAEIADEIERGLRLLSGVRPGVERAGLYAVFDRSWRQLSSEEQRLLAGLSVFRGGFDRDAAGEVAGASLTLLAGLVDKSLLRRGPDGRYAIHTLFRQYAAEQLADRGETESLQTSHLAYFVSLVERAERQRARLSRLSADQDNIRAALSFALSQGDTELAGRLERALPARPCRALAKGADRANVTKLP